MTQTTVDVSRIKDFDAKDAIDSLAHTVEAIAGQPTSIELAGATSGTLTLTVPDVVGTKTLTFPAGTTDFSATGGTSQVVKQATSGGAFTVATVDASDLAGLGTGVATFLATPTSANLASAVTNETGSGLLVFATTPTLTTPVLGAATGTSVTLTGNFVTSAGYVDVSVGNALTAAGTTRADALALTKAVNNVTTAAASTGVILPSAATVGVGGMVVVFNAGANTIQVYAAGSDTIDTVAGSTGVPLTNAKRAIYIVVAANTYVSAQLGVVSA